jgi:hypothetical protein
MSNLPIAAILARDAVEQQFEQRPANRSARERLGARARSAQDRGLRESRIARVMQTTPARGRVRIAAARALHNLADRLEPSRLSPQGARRAHQAAHRDSPW